MTTIEAYLIRQPMRKSFFERLRNISPKTLNAFDITLTNCPDSLGCDIPVHDSSGIEMGFIQYKYDVKHDRYRCKLKLEPNTFDNVVFNFHRVVAGCRYGPLILVNDMGSCLKLWDSGLQSVLCILSQTPSRLVEALIIDAAAGRQVITYCNEKDRNCGFRLLISNLRGKVFVKQIGID